MFMKRHKLSGKIFKWKGRISLKPVQMCKIDFSTTFLNKSFPHWLYDVLFVYGDIVYAIVSFLQDERNNTCFTRRHGGIRTMNVVNIVIFSIQPFKYISMSWSVFSYEAAMNDRTVRVLLPRTERGRSSSIAYRIVDIHKMIGRIERKYQTGNIETMYGLYGALGKDSEL